MLLSLLFHITLVNSAALRRVLEAPPVAGPIVPHRLEESPESTQTLPDLASGADYSQDNLCESNCGPTNISREFAPRSEFDIEDFDLSERVATDFTSEGFVEDDEDQLSAREADSSIPPYPVDEPGKPLKQRPDQLISPAKGFPRNYFNTSNYRPWRPSHDKARPKDRLDWRQPRKSAYCILGGVGKRPVYWQPPMVQDFFNLYHQHDHPETNDMFPFKTRYNRGHDFQYFFNTDRDTNITKAYSIFIVAEKAKLSLPFRLQNYVSRKTYKSAQEKQRLESCRRDCATCWDAAQETGAEQFICNREENNVNVQNLGDGGYCRMAMVLGDPIGRRRICQVVHRGLLFCADQTDFTENYAQDKAVHNQHPSLVCDSIRPCLPGACQVAHDTRLLAQGAGCRMIGIHSGGAEKGSRLPRWGLLGYDSFVQAMNDSSLHVYYQDFTPHPTGTEKAWVLDGWRHFEPNEANRQYGHWWSNYKAGDPVPKGWRTQTLLPGRLNMYNGSVGFGSRPGGFDLKTDGWANALIANLSSMDGWRRENRPNRIGQDMSGDGYTNEPGADDYIW